MLEHPESVVEMQLDHAVKDANGTAYNRAEFIQKRIQMMTDWADYLVDLKLGNSMVPSLALPEFRPVTLRHQLGTS